MVFIGGRLGHGVSGTWPYIFILITLESTGPLNQQNRKRPTGAPVRGGVAMRHTPARASRGGPGGRLPSALVGGPWDREGSNVFFIVVLARRGLAYSSAWDWFWATRSNVYMALSHLFLHLHFDRWESGTPIFHRLSGLQAHRTLSKATPGVQSNITNNDTERPHKQMSHTALPVPPPNPTSHCGAMTPFLKEYKWEFLIYIYIYIIF